MIALLDLEVEFARLTMVHERIPEAPATAREGPSREWRRTATAPRPCT